MKKLTFLTLFCSALVPPEKTKKTHMGLIFDVESNGEVRFEIYQPVFDLQKNGQKLVFLGPDRTGKELKFKKKNCAIVFFEE